MENNLLSLIIFAPLAGAAINWFIGRRVRDERFIGIVACGSVAISTLVAFYLAFKSGGALTSNPMMAAGLVRIGEVADRITDGRAGRGVAHAAQGPCLQQNLVCVLEGAN